MSRSTATARSARTPAACECAGPWSWWWSCRGRGRGRGRDRGRGRAHGPSRRSSPRPFRNRMSCTSSSPSLRNQVTLPNLLQSNLTLRRRPGPSRAFRCRRSPAAARRRSAGRRRRGHRAGTVAEQSKHHAVPGTSSMASARALGDAAAHHDVEAEAQRLASPRPRAARSRGALPSRARSLPGARCPRRCRARSRRSTSHAWPAS